MARTSGTSVLEQPGVGRVAEVNAVQRGGDVSGASAACDPSKSEEVRSSRNLSQDARSLRT